MGYVSTKAMSRDEWLIARQEGIGSSDVAAILGLSRWTTPLDIWKDKIGAITGELRDNEAMEMGRRLESVVAEAYAERTGEKLRRDNKIRIHPTTRFMLCNLDRIIIAPTENGLGPGILEIKTTSSYYAKTWRETVPIEHYVQVQHQFYVTGFKWGRIAFLIDGRHLKTFPIEPDQEQIERQNKILFDFWSDYVCTKLAPPLTVKDYELMTAKPEAIVEANPKTIELITLLRSLKNQGRAIEELERRYENDVKLKIGEAEILALDGDVLATWKTHRRITLDSNGLKAGNPEVWKKYATEKESRRFIIKREEE